MEPKEFTAKTTEEAVKLAGDYFNLPLDQLKVDVLNAGSTGILGFIGRKKARVLVRPVEKSTSMEVEDVMRELTGKRSYTKSNSKHYEEPTKPEETTTSRPSNQPEDEEVIEDAKKVLAKLVEPLDLEATIRADQTQYGIDLEIDSQEIGILIGRRGQTLEALQYLTTRIVSHQQSRPVRINVDAGGYRKRRIESLQELASRMASKARNTKRPVAIGPLNAQERRIVHLALRHEKGLSTSSRGRGEIKKVIISPRF